MMGFNATVRAFAFASLLACSALTAAPVTTVDVFIESDKTPRSALRGVEAVRAAGVTVRVHDLSAKARIEQRLSVGLPGDAETAQRVAAARIRRLDEPTRKQLAEAHHAQHEARRLRVQRTPVFIFDGQGRVYDAHDVYAVWQRQRGAR